MFFIINVCCVYSLESPHQGHSNECTQHTFARQKKKIFLIYPYIVFGGNLCGQERVRLIHGKGAIGVRAIEVLLYITLVNALFSVLKY